MILIVALRGDLHALVVRDRIRETSGVPCHVVQSDALVGTVGFALRPGRSRTIGKAVLPTSEGAAVDVEDCRVVWWRRASYPQLVETGDHLDDRFITAEWSASLRGALGYARGAAWVSDPEATRRASNKPLQLQNKPLQVQNKSLGPRRSRSQPGRSSRAIPRLWSCARRSISTLSQAASTCASTSGETPLPRSQ